MANNFGDIQIRVPRKITTGQIISVKARIFHPMETGLRKDEEMQTIFPAHYITSVKIYYGDKLITHFDWTSAVSKDPLMTFSIRAGKAAPLKIVWEDNKGGRNEKSVDINPQ